MTQDDLASQRDFDRILRENDAVRGYGRKGLIISLFLSILPLWFLIRSTGDAVSFFEHRIGILLTFGGLACWRWGWFMTQAVRAIIYRYIVYPIFRRQGRKAVATVGGVPEVIILATTYKEKPWITNVVFRSVYEELAKIKGLEKAPTIVLATGCDEDDVAMKKVHEQYSTVGASGFEPQLILVRGDQGKRKAIGSALYEVQKLKPNSDGVIVFMDGDSLFRPGCMQAILPIFRLEPKVDAVTTNEDGYSKGPRWFAEWITLRFGLRHRTMCSISLSGKLLCLTGRMSAFRTGVAMNNDFIEQVHNDTLDHWLWGKFDMLSGDDKSTWFWLAKNGSRMLYVPDALVTTIEVVEKQAFQRAFANLKRWSGNTIRNSSRVIKLGPRKLGWFLWWSVVDQRVSMFTVLFGPVMALIAILVGDFDLALAFLVWVIYSRFIHASISWYHGRRFSIVYVPVQVLSEWTMAIIKIWTLFHPASQRWFNRGNRTMDTTQGNSFFKLRKYYANYLVVFSFAVLIWTVSHITGLVNIPREIILPRISRSQGNESTPDQLVGTVPASNYFGYRQNPVSSKTDLTLQRPAPMISEAEVNTDADHTQFFGYSK